MATGNDHFGKPHSVNETVASLGSDRSEVTGCHQNNTLLQRAKRSAVTIILLALPRDRSRSLVESILMTIFQTRNHL